MSHRFDKESGFTLIELLVVIGIIAILTAIAVPMFLSQRQKANDASVASDVKNTATIVEGLLSSGANVNDGLGISERNEEGKVSVQIGSHIEPAFLSDNVHLTLQPSSTDGYFRICGWNDRGKSYSGDKALAYVSDKGGIRPPSIVDRATCENGVTPAPSEGEGGNGDDSGEGSGNGSGEGDGTGNGDGDGNGDGTGEGNGDGNGDENETGDPVVEPEFAPGAPRNVAVSEANMNAAGNVEYSVSWEAPPAEEKATVEEFLLTVTGNDNAGREKGFTHKVVPGDVTATTVESSWQPVANLITAEVLAHNSIGSSEKVKSSVFKGDIAGLPDITILDATWDGPRDHPSGTIDLITFQTSTNPSTNAYYYELSIVSYKSDGSVAGSGRISNRITLSGTAKGKGPAYVSTVSHFFGKAVDATSADITITGFDTSKRVVSETVLHAE